MPTTPPTSVRGHHHQLERLEVHFTREQRALGRPESRDDEGERERREEGVDLRLTVEVGDEPRQGNAEDREGCRLRPCQSRRPSTGRPRVSSRR